MPTVTWARVDPARRAAIVEAAEAEFGAHGFSNGSLNVIARRARVAKGSLFQYFADKRDLYAYIADIGSQRVRSYMENLIRELDPSRPFFEFLTDLLDGWVAYYAEHPRERALHAAATLEVDTDARISVRSVIHRHYLEVLRPLVRDAQNRGHLRADADIDVLLSLLLLLFPHLALAPYMRGLDPVLGSTNPRPSSRRWPCAGWSRSWRRPSPRDSSPNLRRSHDTDTLRLAGCRRSQLEQPAVEVVRRRQRQILGSGRHRLLPRARGLGSADRHRTRLCHPAVRPVRRR
ncbi:bacterial regulatory s, tetR family protein [Mycobacterium kansasii]|uniref:Bacterial regulatory s, tetR family protein n=1 Tax=Mycobacterium kansasii TaxID=1768 RepID=A0A1V3WNT5_MYCKA|nr:bacterial regulatory s, tetR family protein [Mycobacterium kansasii]